jgi:hypothetical protein
MPGERVATDVVGDDLVATYNRAITRLTAQVDAGLRRGLDPARVGSGAQQVGDATLAYRERQRRAAQAIVAELRTTGSRAAPVIAARAYTSTLRAVDRVTVGDIGGLQGRFAGVHQRAAAVLAGNLTRSLEAAATTAGENVDLVFDRAAALEGPLEPGGPLSQFVGRRVDDPWRRLALEELGTGQITGETRRQITERYRERLIREGVTDAATGFVDARGARWDLGTYTEMVTRTTTREATSRGTVNRLHEHGLAIVTISSHPHAADECTPYDGHTFRLPGSTDERYPELDHLPPFHPRCRHVVTPGGVSFEDFERELGIAAEEASAPPPAPPKKGDRVEFDRGRDPYTGEVAAGAFRGKVVEAKGGQLMVNAGTPSKPRWLIVDQGDARLPVRKRPVRAAQASGVEVKPLDSEPLKAAELRKTLGQDRSQLDDAARKAVREYTGNAYADLQRGLRARRTPPLARELDRAFEQLAPLEQHGLVYRGVELARTRQKVEVGRVIEDRGFASTSARRTVADSFAGSSGDLLEIEVPKGGKLLDVNRAARSQFGGESELLLPRGARVVITSIKARPKGKRGRVIRARLIIDD